MVLRISVPKSELEKVRTELKEDQDLSLKDVSEEIEADFKNYLYKGFKMHFEVFNNLRDLYGKDINHELVDFRSGVSYDKRISNLERNEELAEFVGMMLGDGHISDFHRVNEEEKHVTVYKVNITLHKDEEEIISRAEDLFEAATGRIPNKFESKNSKAVNLHIYSKDLVEELKKVGLESGNKTDNQVGVPDWIKENKEFEKACLRGLTDTDGTIYERRHDGYRVVQFKNASRPLIEDFEEMCEDLEISTSKGGYRTVQVAAQDEVDKFIRLINLIKTVD